MHDVQKWHRVLPEHQELANATLRRACQKLTCQQFYNQKHMSINHYLAEKLGRTMMKHELINDLPPMSLDDFVSVSKLSMCFQVTIALSAPQLTPYVHFSGLPLVGQ
jgi:hypothetical protein